MDLNFATVDLNLLRVFVALLDEGQRHPCRRSAAFDPVGDQPRAQPAASHGGRRPCSSVDPTAMQATPRAAEIGPRLRQGARGASSRLFAPTEFEPLTAEQAFQHRGHRLFLGGAAARGPRAPARRGTPGGVAPGDSLERHRPTSSVEFDARAAWEPRGRLVFVGGPSGFASEPLWGRRRLCSSCARDHPAGRQAPDARWARRAAASCREPPGRRRSTASSPRTGWSVTFS